MEGNIFDNELLDYGQSPEYLQSIASGGSGNALMDWFGQITAPFASGYLQQAHRDQFPEQYATEGQNQNPIDNAGAEIYSARPGALTREQLTQYGLIGLAALVVVVLVTR